MAKKNHPQPFMDNCDNRGKIDLNIRYNGGQNRYEVYARPTDSEPGFIMATAQVSVRLPASFPNGALNISSHALVWVDGSQLYAPAPDPGSDYHGIITTGGNLPLLALQEILLFSFPLPPGSCVDDLRFFLNGMRSVPNICPLCRT